MNDSIYIARFLVLSLWWFLTMCEILMVALTGEGLKEDIGAWRDRNTKLLPADEMEKISHFMNDTIGGILK